MFQMAKSKTFFGIYLLEAEDGSIVVKSDHYGPGYASFKIGMQMLENLREIEIVNPEMLKVEGLIYSPRTQ